MPSLRSGIFDREIMKNQTMRRKSNIFHGVNYSLNRSGVGFDSLLLSTMANEHRQSYSCYIILLMSDSLQTIDDHRKSLISAFAASDPIATVVVGFDISKEALLSSNAS